MFVIYIIVCYYNCYCVALGVAWRVFQLPELLSHRAVRAGVAVERRVRAYGVVRSQTSKGMIVVIKEEEEEGEATRDKS